MLDRSAQLLAEIAERWSFPLTWIDASDLNASARGVTTHRECSLAFGGTHHDPGAHFPIDDYIARARRYAARTQVVA
jgi:hypothetical protein